MMSHNIKQTSLKFTFLRLLIVTLYNANALSVEAQVECRPSHSYSSFPSCKSGKKRTGFAQVISDGYKQMLRTLLDIRCTKSPELCCLISETTRASLVLGVERKDSRKLEGA